MKYITLFIFTFTALANAESSIKVVDQEDQLLLIQTLEKYEEVKVKVDKDDCSTSIKEKVGNHAVIKVIKKTVTIDNSLKTACELKTPVEVNSISLTPIKTYLDRTSRVYIGGGLSFAKEPKIDPNANYDTSQINYALAYYNQKGDFLIGGIYQVYSFRAYGSIKTAIPNKTDSYEFQANNFLLGLTTRKLYGDLDKSPTYIRGDLGLSWNNVGTSVIASPFDKALGTGIGANLGVGVMIKAGGGNFDLGLFQSFMKSSESPEMSNITNLALGYMF